MTMETKENKRENESLNNAMGQRQQHVNFSERIKKLLSNFTGHDMLDISSFDDFTNFMWAEVDAASLGICRMLFGK
jgi:hypothetical protein